MVTALLLRQKDKTSSNTISEEQASTLEKEEEGLFCWQCGHYITSIEQSVEVSGGHHHTFFNPAGVVYEIRCFKRAAGCLLYGPSSSEFTWFSGFTWRLSLCAVCTTHLGWFFKSAEMGFYGLITKNLTST